MAAVPACHPRLNPHGRPVDVPSPLPSWSRSVRRFIPSQKDFHDRSRVFAISRATRGRIVFVVRRRPVERRRRGRHRAPADRGPVRAVDAVLLARRTLARVRRPRRAASRGLPDAGRRRPRAAHDLARPRRDGARLDARRRRSCSSPRTASRSSATTARSRSIPRAACRSCCRSARSTTSPFGPGKRQGDRPQHRRSRRAGSAIAAAPPGIFGSMPKGSGTFRRMSELAGNVTSPMWIGERV